MTRLSLEHIYREKQNCEVSSVTSLQLSHRALSDVSCLSNFRSLERLDLSYNCLISLEGLSACANLKWLQVAENKLVTLKGIEGLSKLMVLNAGRNKLQKMDEICTLTNLRALILNDNNISSICKLDQMKHLNTLVLSRNPIHVIGKSLMKATSMTKLSLSHCKLQAIGSSLVSCADLKEARFSHNEISVLPDELAKNVRLLTLDIGNNLIEKWSDIKVLSALENLRNLNLIGNPIAEKDELVKKVKRLLPNLRIFNSKSMETNLGRKVSGMDTLHPKRADSPKISSGFEEDKKRKNSESKRGDAAERKMPNTSVEETNADDISSGTVAGIGPEKRKKRRNSGVDAEVSDTKGSSKKDYSTSSATTTNNVLVQKEENKSKANTKPEKNIDLQNMEGPIDKNVENRPNRKKLREIDESNVPFVDLIYSGKNVEDLHRKKEKEMNCNTKLLGGLVVEHTKKKKTEKSKNMDSGLSEVMHLSSTHEIGMGGLSTWDA